MQKACVVSPQAVKEEGPDNERKIFPLPDGSSIEVSVTFLLAPVWLTVIEGLFITS